MTSEKLRERAARLSEIREEMFVLIDQARQVVRDTPEVNRARSYWLAHLETALHRERVNGAHITMQDTIDTLYWDADDQDAAEA